MDPYLEGSLWTTLQTALAMQIVAELAPRLQPEYLVLPQERLALDSAGNAEVLASSIDRDLSVIDLRRSRTVERDPAPAGGVALAPLRLPTVVPVRIPHVTIEICDRAGRELVAAIEILSPTNKRADGAEEYLVKRRHMLMCQAHLVEIDLLRKGRRVPIIGELPAKPYFVFVNRRDIRPVCDIWPIGMDDPFPVVPVPLRPGEDDALLDPQVAFTAVYDLLRYDLAIDYTSEPDVPLYEPGATWARGILGRRFGRV